MSTLDRHLNSNCASGCDFSPLLRAGRNLIPDHIYHSSSVNKLEPILSDISITNTKVLFGSDYKMNLFQINQEQYFSYFFDTMLSHSFFHKIMFPTQVNHKKGPNLIDDMYSVSYHRLHFISRLYKCQIKSQVTNLISYLWIFVITLINWVILLRNV